MLKFKSIKDNYSFLELKNNKNDYVFLDLEFNCFTDDHNFYEITSIGAVKCDKNFKNINCFHSYVMPTSCERIKRKKQEVSFCKLMNKKIPKKGESFSKVMHNFSKWLGESDLNIFVWGTSDTPVLISNLEATGIEDKFSSITDKIKNIQPEISSYVKVLGNPINYSISLENMKKLFFFNKEVAHNGLLDAIDLMKIFKKYKEKSDINQDILYELSYIYRNVDTKFQFENFKQNEKNKKIKKFNSNTSSRILINNPNIPLIEKIIDTLDRCNFKFTNEYPKFLMDEDNNTLLFNKFNEINNDSTFDTTKANCEVKIQEDKIIMDLEDGDKKETLKILTKYLPSKLTTRLKEELYFSSKIYEDIQIKDVNTGVCTLLNYFLNNGNISFSNNIKNINLLENKLFVKRKKENNSNIAPKYNCNFYIKNEYKRYDLTLNYKCTHKNTMSQQLFSVPKTPNAKEIIHQLIINNQQNKNFAQPKLIDMNDTAKELLTELVNQKALKAKRKTQVFVDSDKLTFLHGRYIEYINFENISLFVTDDDIPTLIMKNTYNGKVYEFRMLKNKNTIHTIKKLFKVYRKYKPKVTKINNLNNSNLELLNKLRNLQEFTDNNRYTYTITNGHVIVKKNIKNEYQNEVYPLNDFNIQINVNKHYNMAINFINKKTSKKLFANCISSKNFFISELSFLLECIDKMSNKSKFKIEYFSKDLLNLLKESNTRKLIVSKEEFLNLDIQPEYFKLKKKKTNHQLSMSIKNFSTEIVISKKLMFLKIYDDKNSFYYSIQNTQSNRALFEKLFKTAKKHKSNSWIKVLGINKNLRNSIWRVVENSKNDSISSLSFDNNYLRAEQKKYLYQNTPMSVKKVDPNKILLQIGFKDSTLYDIVINEKNKIFIDDLINNTLFYEENNN